MNIGRRLPHSADVAFDVPKPFQPDPCHACATSDADVRTSKYVRTDEVVTIVLKA
jgi:hypothetical protein